MKTVFKILVALAAAAGVFFTVKHIIDLINNDEDSKRRIAFLKSKLQVSTRAKNKASDEAINDSLSDLSFDFEEPEDSDIDVIVVETASSEPIPVLSGFDEEDEDFSEDLLESLLKDEEA